MIPVFSASLSPLVVVLDGIIKGRGSGLRSFRCAIFGHVKCGEAVWRVYLLEVYIFQVVGLSKVDYCQ